ncbi:hypothetical protein MSR1_31190 [Magnetospirillum gryphiswaldense MSR-1]|uniref:Uncharacterized protein n=1 Tax=Magnetospirillum gryphiswaldense TaxID=55518 RepID=A4U177_9PROT|nr:hypothetical protein MSR1_31190 [Magnetospirillum gryphiswaldense MSR-1]AVM79488.1 hypothetical protein MSR1L_31190 [Magnetospirillum gryphiswaldense]CAM76634.1 conserved hypothetical protein [Magnetospirillum gryphiswaldense MSR-1]
MATRDFVILSEATLLPTIWRGLTGRRLRVVALHPVVPVLSVLFQRLAAIIMRRGWASAATEGSDALSVMDGFVGDSLFRPHDPAMDAVGTQWCRRVDGAARLAPYAYAFRKCLTDYNVALLQVVGGMEEACARAGTDGGKVRLYGGCRHFADVYAASTGRPAGDWLQFRAWSAALVWNAVSTLFVLVGTVFWLVLRIRPRVEQLSFRLLLDRVSDIDLEVARAAGDPDKVLMVERNGLSAAMPLPAGARYRRVTRADARVPPGRALALLAALAQDVATAWWRLRDLPPPLFSRLVVQLGKRRVWDAFFHRFRPMAFWGRDDYSMDHIVRNQAVRAVGGTAIGVNHGLPMNTYVGPWRQIDFDIYYTFGSHTHQYAYADTWAPGMQVVPVGNIQMTPARRARLSAPRPRDVAVYGIVIPRLSAFLDEIAKLAQALPDRRVIVRMKPKRDDHFMTLYRDWLVQAPANVVDHVDPDPYDLMLSTSYAVTPGSTAGAEALQFGAVAFYMDMEPGLRFFYYRNFPTLVVYGGDQIATRIKAIETGSEVFDFQALRPLIDIGAPDFYTTFADTLNVLEQRVRP